MTSTRSGARRARTRSPRSAGRAATSTQRRARGRRGRRAARTSRWPGLDRRARACRRAADAGRASRRARARERQRARRRVAVRSRRASCSGLIALGIVVALGGVAHQRARQQRRRHGRALRATTSRRRRPPRHRVRRRSRRAPSSRRSSPAARRPRSRRRPPRAASAAARCCGRSPSAPPIKRLRNGGYGRLTNLRVAPERIDATLITQGGAPAPRADRARRRDAPVRHARPSGFGGAPTMSLKDIDAQRAAAPDASAAERLGVPPSRVNYLVYTQFAGRRAVERLLQGRTDLLGRRARADHAAHQLTRPGPRAGVF